MTPFTQTYWGWLTGETTPEDLADTFHVFDPTYSNMVAAMAQTRTGSIRQAKVRITIEIEDTTDTESARGSIGATEEKANG